MDHSSTQLSFTKLTYVRATPTEGVKRLQRMMIETIKFQTDICLMTDGVKYFNLFTNDVKNYGLLQAINLHKDLSLFIRNVILEQPKSVPQNFAVRDNWPRRLLFLKKYSKTYKGEQAILSLVFF